MALQRCSHVANVVPQDVAMSAIDATSAWIPTTIVRLASLQLSSWFCKPPLASPYLLQPSSAAGQPEPSIQRAMKATTFNNAGRNVANIHALPTELLEMVFHHYTHTLAPLPYDDPDFQRLRMTKRDKFRKCVGVLLNATTNPIFLGQVCSRWRALATQSPYLWNKIAVLRPRPNNVPLFALWIQRSAQKPLDLTIIQDSDDVNRRDTSTIRDLFQLILDQHHRWKHLALRLYHDTGPLFRSMLEHRSWGPSPVPLLEGIAFQRLEDWTEEECETLFSILYSSPKLQKLTFRRLMWADPDIIWTGPLHQITSVDLDYFDGDQLFRLLSACPSLTNLSIRHFEGPVEDQEDLVLPSLQTLTLGGMEDATAIFNHLTLPSLTSIGLLNGFGFCIDPSQGWGSLSSMLHRSTSFLADATIGDLDEHEKVLVDMLSSPLLSRLSSLTIKSRVTDMTISCLTGKPISRLLPFLSTLWILRCQCTATSLSRMLSSRADTLLHVHAPHDPFHSQDGLILSDIL